MLAIVANPRPLRLPDQSWDPRNRLSQPATLLPLVELSQFFHRSLTTDPLALQVAVDLIGLFATSYGIVDLHPLLQQFSAQLTQGFAVRPARLPRRSCSARLAWMFSASFRWISSSWICNERDSGRAGVAKSFERWLQPFLAEQAVLGQRGQTVQRGRACVLVAGFQRLTCLVAGVPGVKAIHEVEAGALDVLNSHDAVQERRRRLVDDPLNDLFARGVIVFDHHQLASEPFLQCVAQSLRQRMRHVGPRDRVDRGQQLG